MKYLFLCLAALFICNADAQNVQLLYDLRHSVDAARNPKNYPSLYFEYFKEQDSGKAFIKPGAFLFKMQSDLMGSSDNIGKTYVQLTQTIRFWTPKIFLHFSYSGGLGVTEPKQYSYYILNTYAAGIAYPFQWKGGYFSAVLDYQYVTFTKPSHDLLWTLYFYKGFFNYGLELLGDLNLWTSNRNHGDSMTSTLSGKQLFFYGEPQLWYRLKAHFFAGARLNIYYNVNFNDNRLEFYPAVGLKWKI
jgi:hypothetical protein